MNLKKIKNDEESLFNHQLNIERTNENISTKEMKFVKFIRKNKISYEMKMKNETIVNLKEEDESAKKDEIIKADEEKIINYNNNISSPKVIKLTLINSDDIKIKTTIVQNIKKRRALKIDKINKILEQDRRDKIIEKKLYYQNIDKSYISNLINFLNDELNWLFLFLIYIIINIFFSNETIAEQRLIMQYKISICKNIILFFIFGIITFFSERIFKIELRREINYIKGSLLKFFDFDKRKNIMSNDNKLKGKGEKKRNNDINKITITNNNYIIIIMIKLIIIIYFVSRTLSNIHNLYFYHNSKITLKVKGRGEHAIFNKNFKSINYLKEVYINENKQNKIAYKYIFNQENNFVELIWNDNIDNTENMFRECKSITEMNLSYFNTTFVTSMDNMFEGCSSLTSLDLNNFNTKLVNTMIFMFSRCSLLTSLDLSYFDTSSVTRMDSMFSHCSSLILLNLSNFNTSSVISMDSMFYECKNLEYINLDNFDKRKIKQNMFKKLRKDLVICIKEITKNKLNKALHYQSYSLIIDKNRIIIDCSKDWKTKQRRITNSPDNYECKSLNQININSSNFDFSKYIQYSNNENNSYCFGHFGEGKSEEEIKYYDNILNSVENIFTSQKFDTKNIDQGKDEFIKFEKMMVTFTTSDNQKNNINNKISNINLGECEILLRNFYNISSKEKLYMKKIDIIQEDMITIKVEYDIYCKLFGKNLIKLNLTVCENSKVSIYIPFSMVGNIDEYNSNSGYYNDICYSTKTEDGTDITLKDRQKIFISENKIVCQEDCVFSEYDPTKFKANCLCNARESSNSYSNMKINKDKLLENFKDIKNFANFNFLVCYKKLLNKEGIIKNIGFYFLLIIILFHIMAILIFYLNQFSSLKLKINGIILGINKIRLIYEGKKGKKKKHKKKIKNQRYVNNLNLIQNSSRKQLKISKKFKFNNITTNILHKKNNKRRKIKIKKF